MYTWLTKNILFVHLILLTAAAGWIHGGTRSDLLYPVLPWLTILVLECLLLFPQAKEDETLVESRERVWHALLRDPLTWVSLLLIIVLVIPLFNSSAAPIFDAKTGKWSVALPPYPYLPFCNVVTLHASTLLWFCPTLVAVLAAKHGLLKKSKRMLFEAICWIGVSLSLLGFAQLASGTKALLWLKPLNVYFFSTFGYTNLAGAYFTMMAALSFGLWMQHLGEKNQMILFPTIEHAEEMSILSANRMLLAFIVNVAGAIASVSRAAILFCSVLMMVLVLYGFCFVWRRVTKPMKWLFSASVLGVFVTAIALIISFPVKNIQHEAEGISTSAVLERVTGVGGQNSRVAMEILVKYPIFGVGGRHYALYRPLFWKGDYAKTLDCPCANAHNDIYQFMAEYGIVGFGLMVGILAVLVGSIIYAVLRMMFAQRLAISMTIRDKGSAPFYRIPPPAMVVLVATVILIAHAYGDVVMRTPAILLVWLLALTSVSGWFPVFKKAK